MERETPDFKKLLGLGDDFEDYEKNIEIRERSYGNSLLISKGLSVLRGIRGRVNTEMDPKYLNVAYEQALQIALVILADCDIKLDSADKKFLEQITVRNYQKFMRESANATTTYEFPSQFTKSALYRLALKLKAKSAEVENNKTLDQQSRVYSISQDYFLNINQLGSNDLQNISSKRARFVSPLSGGLVATLIWKLVIEKVTNKTLQPKVLGAAVDSKKGRAYFQVDSSIISEDEIKYVYILDDSHNTGKTRNIVAKSAGLEYYAAKIYYGSDDTLNLEK